MYAIIKAGGRQFKVAENDVIQLDRLAVPEGDEIVVNEVMLVSDDGGVKIGAPYVAGAAVHGKVLRHYKGRKIRGFTYKPKKDIRRRFGHRQLHTAVQIAKIESP